MARAGMLQRGRNTGAEGVDDVQRSLELLDKVLSEFDEGEPLSLVGALASEGVAGAGAATTTSTAVTPADSAAVSSTPDDDSPSLGGHQSEDDGYMSMNGRRAKFALSFRPTDEKGELAASNTEGETPLSPPQSDISVSRTAGITSPPPPEEAERIISTLLPKVSPANSVARNPNNHEIQKPCHLELIEVNGKAINTATQTTLPKTRHQRPFGWDKSPQQNAAPAFLHQAPNAPCRFASLPNGGRQLIRPGPSPAWLPPRQDIKYERNTTATNPHCIKKSPNGELVKASFPLQNPFGFPSEFNKPYNEHPVTIYPGANVPYNIQLQSPTHGLPRNGPLSASYSARTSPHAADNLKKTNPRRDFKSDDEILSPLHKMPPRTLAGSMEKHREVCRGHLDDVVTTNSSKKSYSTATDEEHFSDDSLEESLPPPPPVVTPSKRSSIAWEVSLDDDILLTPGSTKVIGRRRRKSGDSNSGSIPRRVDDSSSEWIAYDQDGEYWPPPPLNCSTEDEMHSSPFSDPEPETAHLPPDVAEINSTGTYVIRRGKNRKQLPTFNNKLSNKSNQHSAVSLSSNHNTGNSIDGSNVSISGSAISGSHNSGSSLNSRLSSDLSIPQSRFSADMNNSPRYSRELLMPNSRYSVDLTTPQNRYSKELTSPKSRLSLDLNNGQERHLSRDFFNESPRNKKQISEKYNRQNIITNKLSPQNKFTDFRKYSSTFDNIQSLIKESAIENCAPPPDFEESPPEIKIVPPNVVRVVSLPSLSLECDTMTTSTRQPLITTVEEEEDQDSGEQQSSGSTSPLRKIENNISAILSQGRDQKHFSPHIPKDWDIHKDEYAESIAMGINGGYNYSSKERSKRPDIQKSSSHNAIPSQRSVERRERSSYRKNCIQKSTSAKEMPHILNRQMSSSDSTSSCGDFPINVQVIDHSFRTHPLPSATSKSSHEFGPLPKSPDSPKLPPLPPSPVQEDDEYSEILQPIDKSRGAKKADTLPTPNSDPYYRNEVPPEIPPHHEQSNNSLKTRSMDTSFSKNRRHNGSNKQISSDRRTLPTDISAGGARRRTLQRQNREATPPGSRLNTPLQTSASLPETPIFARGCDVPRTPLRQTAGSMVPRQSNTMNSIQTISGNSTLGGYGRGSTLSGSLMGTGSGVDRALTGAELLRLAGGPARGWYPKQRHRPASIEHLDHLTVSSSSASNHGPIWDGSAARKPLTLPPNLTPKFFHKSPREALRRVTSLLIRKGNNGNESKKNKEAVSPAAHSANGDEHSGHKQRKGFFRSFWKKSRHYSLEHP